MSIELLKHEIERFGVVTVMDATIYDIVTNKPVLFLDTLKLSNITAEGQEKTITGGRFADLLLTYNFGRSMNLEFQDALLSPLSMETLWGAALADNVTAHNFINYTATAADVTAAEFDFTIVDVKGTAVTANYNVLSVVNMTTGGEVTYTDIEDGTVTVTAGFVAGNQLRIDYQYTVANAENVKELVLTSSSFPTTVKLVGKTFVLNQSNGQQVQFEIEVPKLKLASNFSMTLDAEGDASVFDFSGMALVNGTDKELIKFKLLG